MFAVWRATLISCMTSGRGNVLGMSERCPGQDVDGTSAERQKSGVNMDIIILSDTARQSNNFEQFRQTAFLLHNWETGFPKPSKLFFLDLSNSDEGKRQSFNGYDSKK